MGKRIERGRARFMLDCPKCHKRTSVSVPTMKGATLTPDSDAIKWLMSGEMKFKHKPCGYTIRVKVWTMHAAYIADAGRLEAPIV